MRNEDKIAYLEKWKDFYRNYGGNHTVDIENLDFWIEEVRRNETTVKEEPKQVYYSPIPGKFEMTKAGYVEGQFRDGDFSSNRQHALILDWGDSELLAAITVGGKFMDNTFTFWKEFRFPAYGPNNLPPVGIPYKSKNTGKTVYASKDLIDLFAANPSRFEDAVFHGFKEAWIELVEEES